MPLWTVHHGEGSLTAADRQLLASEITEIYSILPRFYVDVVFVQADPDGLYVGGVLRDRFVRIAVDHIARSLPDAAARRRFMERVNAVFVPFMAQRSLSWELHIDETDRELWVIEGLRPPEPGSAAEKEWAAQNAPVPYETDAASPSPR